MPRQARPIPRSENSARAGIVGVYPKSIRSGCDQGQARAPVSGPGPEGRFLTLKGKVVPLKGIQVLYHDVPIRPANLSKPMN